MNFGIIYNEPSEVYHGTDCVGSHRLDDLTPYPILFRKRWVTKEIPPDEGSPAMAFGRYFHTLSLEGEDAAARGYAVAPVCDKRTTAGKATYAAFLAESEGKQVISADDQALAWRMVKAIREKPSAVKLLAQGKPEVTFRQQMASFAIQARVDWFDDTVKDAPMLIDVKSVDSLEAFDAHFFKFNYFRQAAFYRLVVAKVLGLETFQPQFCYIVVEKNEPFQCAIRIPDAESLAIGTKEVMADLHRLKTCYDSKDWPGEPDEARPVSLPEWKVKQAQQ
jgi:hypothetical protein